MKTKCKSTRKKGQNKHTLQDFKLTVFKAESASEPSSRALRLSPKPISASRGLPHKDAWGAGGNVSGRSFFTFERLVSSQGLHREPLLGQHSLCQWSVLFPPIPSPLSPQPPLPSAALGADASLLKNLQEPHLLPPLGTCVRFAPAQARGEPTGCQCEFTPDFLPGYRTLDP